MGQVIDVLEDFRLAMQDPSDEQRHRYAGTELVACGTAQCFRALVLQGSFDIDDASRAVLGADLSARLAGEFGWVPHGRHWHCPRHGAGTWAPGA